MILFINLLVHLSRNGFRLFFWFVESTLVCLKTYCLYIYIYFQIMDLKFFV
ncbi:hypothetical protein Hanom_Chr15g01384501 [Helianthus anomalus]